MLKKMPKTRTMADLNNEFLQNDFSMDEFLQVHSANHSLEELRDELNGHLKTLETKIIDIVNSESDTILTLSSSLNGLDNKVQALVTCLGQLQEELRQVLHSLQTNIENIERLMESEKICSDEKENILNVLQAVACCDRIKNILKSSTEIYPLSSDILLRAVDQYILQEIHLQKCDKTLLTLSEKQDFNHVSKLLFENLEDTFLNAVNTKHKDDIISCLRMQIFLNNEKNTENLVRKKIVAPKLQKIIDEFDINISELSQLYTKIIIFVQSELGQILTLTYPNNNLQLTGFNFPIKSIWLELDEQLHVNLSSIYAPGNPNTFQNRFIETTKFISELNSIFPNTSETNIFEHPSYDIHMQRWNLPVYYQIRFHEIATNLEEILIDTDIETYINEENSEFKLKSTQHVWNSIQRCLSADVFISQITHCFWRLILQILSRYNTWINANISSIESSPDLENDQKLLEMRVGFFVYVILDINTLSAKLEAMDLSMITEVVRNMCLESVDEELKQLNNQLPKIKSIVCKIISASSSVALKQVLHIPRLYRKTNRSVPTAHSQYVNLVLLPPKTFYESFGKKLRYEILNEIITDIYSVITKEYYAVVNEILTSVRKTEDSLRRLKKSKVSQTDAGTINDDQKIRIQLQLDVNFYCQEVKLTAENVDIQELHSLVKDL